MKSMKIPAMFYSDMVERAHKRIVKWKEGFRPVPFYPMSDGDYAAPNPFGDEGGMYRGVCIEGGEFCAIFQPSEYKYKPGNWR